MVEKTKIPKCIHYCWFGDEEKPEIVNTCLSSWKKHLPDYRIVEWNESNFNIESNRYAQEAYETGNYLFINDYVKLYVLYHHGGVYLDANVEVFKSFNTLLHHESFWGFEQGNVIATSTIGAARGNRLIKLFLDHYRHKKFTKEDGSYNESTSKTTITEMLEQIGVERSNKYQKLTGTGAFYPQAFFSPSTKAGALVTNETYTIQHSSNNPLQMLFNSGIKKLIQKD